MTLIYILSIYSLWFLIGGQTADLNWLKVDGTHGNPVGNIGLFFEIQFFLFQICFQHFFQNSESFQKFKIFYLSIFLNSSGNAWHLSYLIIFACFKICKDGGSLSFEAFSSWLDAFPNILRNENDYQKGREYFNKIYTI